MAFHVGQLVVCVDDARRELDIGPLHKGAVYTIREIEDCPRRGLGVRVCEINPALHGDWAYCASRFRPITEERLAIFRQHLVPKRDEVSA